MADLEIRYSNKSPQKITEEIISATCKAPCANEHKKRIKEAVEKQIAQTTKTHKRVNESQAKRSKNIAGALCSMFQHLHDTNPQYKNCEQSIIVKTHEKKLSLKEQVEQLNKPADVGSDHFAQIDREYNQEVQNMFCYQYYQDKLRLASSGIGLLVLTDTFKDKGLDCTDPASARNQQTISSSINFMKEKNQEFIDNANKNMAKTLNAKTSRLGSSEYDELVTENLMKMFKENPASTGQTLLSDPSHSKLACEILAGIEEDDEWQEKVDSTVRIGGAIVGGALAVGSLVAPPLGIPAGAVLTMTTASVGLTLGSGLYSASEMSRLHNLENDIKLSFYSNNGDAKSLSEAREAYEGKMDAGATLLIDAVTLGFDGVSLAKLAKFQGAAKMMPEIADATKTTKSSDLGELLDVNGGNNWNKNWHTDPSTQQKIKGLNSDFDSWIMGRGKKIRKRANILENYPTVPEPSQIEDMKKFKEFKHLVEQNKINGIAVPNDAKYPKSIRGKAFVFEEVAKNPGSTAIHEGTHYVMNTDVLYSAKAEELLEAPVLPKGEIFEKFGINHYTPPGERFQFAMYVEQVSSPPEFHARLNQLRQHYNLKPGQDVDMKFVKQVMEDGLNRETPVSPNFFEMIGNEKAFMNAFNEMF